MNRLVLSVISLITLLVINCCNKLNDRSTSEDLYKYDVEERINELGITLEEPVIPPGINFSPAVISGNIVYLSGNGPLRSDGTMITGKVISEVSVDEAYEASRLTAINHLSVLKSAIGDLNRVERIVKVLGMINSDSSFKDHPKVVNGYSDLMVQVFGERGKHARSAVGMHSLPWNICCEFEAIVQISN